MCLQLYREVQKLLSSYQDLMSQFAAFLQPGQAVDCNCLIDNLLYTRADRCILALQVNLSNIELEFVELYIFSQHSFTMPNGLYFTAVVFSFFFFCRHLISEITERDLNQTWTHIHL